MGVRLPRLDLQRWAPTVNREVANSFITGGDLPAPPFGDDNRFSGGEIDRFIVDAQLEQTR